MSELSQDVVREFLVESHENLARLDRELVDLEERPRDAALLGSVFRTIHTIKGTCGFLGFSTLEQIAHEAENLLSQVRDGERGLDPVLVSLILQSVDAIRTVLASIESTGREGSHTFSELTERLRQSAGSWAARQATPVPAKAAAPEAPRVPEVNPEDPPAHETAAPGQPKEESLKSSAIADSNIRVGVGLLDKLMDLVGELVLTRNQILQFNTEREDAALNATAQRLNLITTELQEGVMKTRMQPIGMVWSKLPRLVRDIAVAERKQIRLEMDGAETELDRTIIEAIKDPLVHLVRNACDHGIEIPAVREQAGKPAHGRLTLRAYHEGGQVNIEVFDDGAGIDLDAVKRKAVERGLLRPEQAAKLSDREALNLVFQAGVSTARTVTTVSGRGVGMDVVRSHIEKIGGIVDLFSRPGEGCTIKLKIPLTLAIIPGLVVSSGGERFVIPQVSLLELIRLEGDSTEKHIEHVHGTPVYRRRGSLLPIAYLNEVLGLPAAARAEAVNVVVLQAEDRQFGLVVDGINDTQEIVVKPLGKQLKGLTVYAGATIMGDGRVALILDVLGIGQRSGVLAESREQTRAAAAQAAQAANELQRWLLFRAGSFERLAVPLSLVARLEEFPRASIERAGGALVAQYRNRILPLLPLKELLEPGGPDLQQPADPVQVIVFSDKDRSIGVVVDEILDVAEEAVTVRRTSIRRGLLGSAVVGKRVADFLDLNYILSSAGEDWVQSAGGSVASRVLVADPSPFSRGLIRNGLDMAGYHVVESAGVEEALRLLEHNPIDVVVTAADLRTADGLPFRRALRQRPEWADLPILELAETPEQARGCPADPGDLRECQLKFDRPALLSSLQHLAAAVASRDDAPVSVSQEKQS